DGPIGLRGLDSDWVVDVDRRSVNGVRGPVAAIVSTYHPRARLVTVFEGNTADRNPRLVAPQHAFRDCTDPQASEGSFVRGRGDLRAGGEVPTARDDSGLDWRTVGGVAQR